MSKIGQEPCARDRAKQPSEMLTAAHEIVECPRLEMQKPRFCVYIGVTASCYPAPEKVVFLQKPVCRAADYRCIAYFQGQDIVLKPTCTMGDVEGMLQEHITGLFALRAAHRRERECHR